jgi:hypothetical protein
VTSWLKANDDLGREYQFELTAAIAIKSFAVS